MFSLMRHRSLGRVLIILPLPRYGAAWLVTALLIAIVGCRENPTLQTSRKFQDAEQGFSDATTPEEFQRAAALYQEILDDGFQSGSIYYNLGNAWMQAGQTGRAVAAYRVAKRHLPRDPYLDANLQQALRRSGRPTPKMPLLDYVFFWQSFVSYAEKVWLVTALLAIALCLGLLMQWGWHRTAVKRLNGVLIVVLILASLSLGRDWYNFEVVRRGAIVSETVARKGGSETYEPAFNQPLPDGTEFVVLGEQDNWLRIKIDTAGEGWVPGRNVAVY